MLNTQFRRGKGVKEINNAIICETYAYVIVACINVKQKCSKSKLLVYTDVVLCVKGLCGFKEYMYV